MNSSKIHLIAYHLLCAVVLCTGTAFALYSIMTTPSKIAGIRRDMRNIEELNHLRTENEARILVVDVFEKMTAEPGPSLESMLATRQPPLAADVRNNGATQLAPGWTIQHVDLVFKNVDLRQLSGFIYEAQTQQPPWTVGEYNINATGVEPGIANVILSMRRVGRNPANMSASRQHDSP